MKTLKKNKLLIAVALAYIAVAIFSRQTAVDSIKNSSYYIKEMLLIMPVVFIMIVFIETWIPKKKIAEYLGEESGIKGTVFSFLLGSLSAGPVYAAFPLCNMLLKKGASVKNIVIIIGAWAVIKVPMLANEGRFLGLEFMATRWMLTVPMIYLMAVLMGRTVRKSDIEKQQDPL